MMAPRVSVLLPYRHAESTIVRALESIAPQLEGNELVLVENQETEDEQVRAFCAAHPYLRIRVVRETKPGIVSALNAGFQHCRGKFIARMDADDEMLDNRLNVQASWLEAHPEFDLVAGLAEFAGSADSKGYAHYVDRQNAIVSEEDILALRFVESPFAHPSVMFRASICDGKPLYREGDFPEDYELWLRWMAEGRRMAKLPVAVVRWHDSEGRLSRTHEAYGAEAFRKIRMEYLCKWLHQQPLTGKSIWVVGGGVKSRPSIRALIEAGIPVKGITDFVPRQLYGLPFRNWNETPHSANEFFISLVSNRDAWLEIRAFLTQRGYRTPQDFILAS